MTPKHRYGLRILLDWTTEKQRPWFVINIQWFTKDWHIFQVLSTHKMCQPLAKDCIIHFLPWSMVDRYISTFCQNWPISNYCKELTETENSINLKLSVIGPVIGPLIRRKPSLRGVWPWGLANQRQLANTGKNGLKRIPPYKYFLVMPKLTRMKMN